MAWAGLSLPVEGPPASLAGRVWAGHHPSMRTQSEAVDALAFPDAAFAGTPSPVSQRGGSSIDVAASWTPMTYAGAKVGVHRTSAGRPSIHVAPCSYDLDADDLRHSITREGAVLPV